MKNFKISATLGEIALVCALLIALINMVTSPIISANDKKTELETCKEIFDKYDESKSESKSGSDLSGKNESIIKIIYAKDSSGVSPIPLGQQQRLSCTRPPRGHPAVWNDPLPSYDVQSAGHKTTGTGL